MSQVCVWFVCAAGAYSGVCVSLLVSPGVPVVVSPPGVSPVGVSPGGTPDSTLCTVKQSMWCAITQVSSGERRTGVGVADSFAVPAFAPSRLKNTGTSSAAAGEVTRLPRNTRSRKYASCFVHASHTAVWEKTPCRLEQASLVSYKHLRAHETRQDLVCRLLLVKKNTTN